jgi:hypothetical protein
MIKIRLTILYLLWSSKSFPTLEKDLEEGNWKKDVLKLYETPTRTWWNIKA